MCEQRWIQHQSEVWTRIHIEIRRDVVYNLCQRRDGVLCSCVFKSSLFVCSVCTLNYFVSSEMFTHVPMSGNTCANKDGRHTKVTCGHGYLAKHGGTACTTCANDGNECCTRTLYSVVLFASVFCHMPTQLTCFGNGRQDLCEQRWAQYQSHVWVRVLSETRHHVLYNLHQRRE